MSCGQCNAPKTVSECGICKKILCKACRETLAVKDFELLEKRPADLSHSAYCGECFDLKVRPALEQYEKLELLAKNVYFQSNNFRGNSHILSKYSKTISIEKCADRRQLILMLAYKAAELNYNAIVSADIRNKRIYAEGGYGHYEWSGTAIPANINGAQFEASRVD
jgi:hypothetical protein